MILLNTMTLISRFTSHVSIHAKAILFYKLLFPIIA